MFTLGYPFRPWPEARAIADGPSIREYVRATARERGVDQLIRFQHRVDQRRLGQRRRAVDGHRRSRREPASAFGSPAHGLSVCTGYYRYDEGYRPTFPARSVSPGTLLYPQSWPQDLDWTGKQVVVIGSGATAVTLVPSLAERAAHVTMLQRTPSYMISLPGVDPIAKAAHAVPARPDRASARAMEERDRGDPALRVLAAPPEGDAQAAAQGRHRRAARGLRRRRALQPAVQAVGSAHVPAARRRPLRVAELGQGRSRHRPHRDLPRARHRTRVRPGTRRRHHRLRDRAAAARARRDGASPSTAPRSTCPTRCSTRG